MTLSIITINYNNCDGLQRTIDSIAQQDCNDFELIVVDGGSTDGSVDTVKENANKITQWVSEPDSGIYNAMNKGVAMAHGKYCIFINSGDELFSADVVRRVLPQLTGEDIVCGDLCYGENNICPNPDTVTMRTFYKHTLYHQASLIRTQLLRDNPYDEQMRSAADWKFFMHELVFRNASYKHIQMVIARFEAGGVSSTNPEQSQREVMEELQRCFPQRVLDDYEDYTIGATPFRRMFTQVELIPPIRKIIYRINVILLKIINTRLKSDWIRKLPKRID